MATNDNAATRTDLSGDHIPHDYDPGKAARLVTNALTQMEKHDSARWGGVSISTRQKRIAANGACKWGLALLS
jgi:hypothetical protein